LVRTLRTVVRMNRAHRDRAEKVRWSPRLLNELTHSPDLATAAERLTCRGIPVFPCAPGEKRPLTVHGFQDASADREAVDRWWRRWPDANIGIPTGAASGVDVVDVDIHSPGTGFPAFERARRSGFVAGWAWLVRTPSGGVHAYFLRGSARGSGRGRSRASTSISEATAATSSSLLPASPETTA